MLLRLFAAATLLVCPGIALGQQPLDRRGGQDQTSRYGRLFGQVVERSEVREHLAARLDGLAREYKLPDEKLKQLKSSIDKMLPAIGNELGDDYANGDNDDKSRVRAIITGIRSDPELVELTKAWEKLVKSALTGRQFSAWKKNQKKRHPAVQRKLDDLAQQRRVRVQPDRVVVGAARMAPAIGGFGGRRVSPAMFRSLLERYQTSFEQRLKADVQRLVNLCGLDEKQVRRLEVAQKGAISKTFDGIRDELRALEENNGEVTQELTTKLTALRTPDSSFWEKAVQSTLTDHQRQKLEDEDKKRASFGRTAYAYQLVAYFDTRATLADAQRVKLLRILNEVPLDQSPHVGSRTSVSRWSAQLPEPTRMAIGDVLSPEQMRALTLPTAARGALDAEAFRSRAADRAGP